MLQASTAGLLCLDLMLPLMTWPGIVSKVRHLDARIPSSPLLRGESERGIER